MKCLALLLLAAVANADQFDSVRNAIRSKLASEKVPSLAVAVARNGRIVWEEGFGWADVERKIPADAHTPYSLASISKPITATALMILVERGRVNLDKPVNDYLGAVKVRAHVGDAATATVRRVANHSSGLPLHYQFFYEDEPYRVPPRDETIRRYGNLIAQPGERYTYSNLGYGILDYVISRASGRPYAAFLLDEVLTPLGMSHSAAGVPAAFKDRQAVRYGAANQPLPFYDFDHPGGSAVFASAHDLATFGMFHLKNRLPGRPILTNRSIDEMHRGTATISPGSGYGIGWRIDSGQSGRPVISHSGSMGGVSTRLLLYPRENIAIVTLCNSSTTLSGEIAREIARVLGVDRPPSPSPAEASATLAKSVWRGKVETYSGNIPISIEIASPDRATIRLADQDPQNAVMRQSPNGFLTTRFRGNIGTDDANRTQYSLLLDVRIRGNVMNGGITAQSTPVKRPGNALTYWIELRRE
jgi:CubicO group peptidase (beta-lactamase class C family)